MSTGLILKKREDVEFDRLLHDIKLAADRAGLEARIDSNAKVDFGKEVYTEGNIADTFEDIPGAEQWLMYIHSDDEWGFFEYGDIRAEEGLIRVVFIEDAPDCKNILLDFLFEYFKLNPKDYFWTDGAGWHYTYEDIKRFKQNDFDPDWCNKDPHTDDAKD